MSLTPRRRFATVSCCPAAVIWSLGGIGRPTPPAAIWSQTATRWNGACWRIFFPVKGRSLACAGGCRSSTYFSVAIWCRIGPATAPQTAQTASTPSKLRRPACGRYTERTASSTAVTIRWWDSWVTIWSRYNGRMMAQWKRSATERCRCGVSSGTRNACPPPTADCLTVFCSTVPFFPAGFCKKHFAICR